MVAQTLGSKWIGLGHDVVLGTRDPGKLDDAKRFGSTLREWRAQTEHRGKVVTFREAAAHGDVVVNATSGLVSIDALRLAAQDRCLAEKIQAEFPNLKVVKTLNTINALVMVNPKGVAGGDHTVFVSGNDAGAKAQVTELLKGFGWTDVLDLGNVSTARGPEMYMALWSRLWGATGTGNLNIKVQR